MNNVVIKIFPRNNINKVTTLTKQSESTLKEIIFNKTEEYCYSVIYSDDVFAKLDTQVFADNLINTLHQNLPDIKVSISLFYIPMNSFSKECCVEIIHLNDYLEDHQTDNITYIESNNIEHFLEMYDEDENSFNFNELEISNDEENEENDYVDDFYDRMYGVNDEDELSLLLDDDDDEDDKKKPRKKKKSYESSRIIKESSNPKKNFKRHGIIILPDKTSKKRDEKIIKSFLKDFIPGNATWIKELREELAERWIDSYAISKKSLKKFEKQHRKQKQFMTRNKNESSGNAIANLTRNLFIDNWNNPNK